MNKPNTIIQYYVAKFDSEGKFLFLDSGPFNDWPEANDSLQSHTWSHHKYKIIEVDLPYRISEDTVRDYE
jgi:hypothetical protein